MILQKAGRLAQLGEHHVRNVGVEGSNPLPSITKKEGPNRGLCFFARLLD